MAVHRIVVRFNGGTHTTNTVRGCRASSTSDYRTAAWNLCIKLFEGRPFVLQCLEARCGVHVFEVSEAAT